MRNLISSTLMLLAVASVAQADHAPDGKQLRERDQQFPGCPIYIATAQIQPRNVSTDDLNRAPVHGCRDDCEKPAAAALQLDRNNPLTLYTSAGPILIPESRSEPRRRLRAPSPSIRTFLSPTSIVAWRACGVVILAAPMRTSAERLNSIPPPSRRATNWGGCVHTETKW